MRKILLVLPLLAASLFAPAGVQAQIPGVDVSFTARGGAYVPVSGLYEIRGDAQEVLRKQEGSLSVGASLDVNIPLSPFDVRLNADYVTGSTVRVQGSPEASASSDQAKLLYVGGDVVIRPLPRLVVVQPYALLGGAYRHASYDGASFQQGGVDGLTSGQPAAHVGLGADIGFGGLGVVAEVSNYTTRNESGKFEHDAFVQVGLKLSLF